MAQMFARKARGKVASIRTSLKQEKLVLSEMSKLLTNSVKFEDAARRAFHENFAVSQEMDLFLRIG